MLLGPDHACESLATGCISDSSGSSACAVLAGFAGGVVVREPGCQQPRAGMVWASLSAFATDDVAVDARIGHRHLHVAYEAILLLHAASPMVAAEC